MTVISKAAIHNVGVALIIDDKEIRTRVMSKMRDEKIEIEMDGNATELSRSNEVCGFLQVWIPACEQWITKKCCAVRVRLLDYLGTAPDAWARHAPHYLSPQSQDLGTQNGCAPRPRPLEDPVGSAVRRKGRRPRCADLRGVRGYRGDDWVAVPSPWDATKLSGGKTHTHPMIK